MSFYPEDYHRAHRSQRLDAPNKATEAITEIYCEREALEPFMDEVREYARRDAWNIIYGTVRLIEQDRESFLAWARKPYACVIFNLHIEHTTGGVIRGADALRAPDRHRPAPRRQLLPHLQPLRPAPPGRRLLSADAGVPQAQAQVRSRTSCSRASGTATTSGCFREIIEKAANNVVFLIWADPLWMLLGLFVLRVAGQAMVAFWGVTVAAADGALVLGPHALPAAATRADRASSSLMAKICSDFTRRRGFFVRPRRFFAGPWLWFGWVYLAVMLARLPLQLLSSPTPR